MNPYAFVKQEISKRYNVGESRIVFTGKELVDKLKTKTEIRALVRTHDAWFRKAIRDQSKRAIGQLVTIIPIKSRNYKIYDRLTWKKLPKADRPKLYKLKDNKSDPRAYRLHNIRALRAELRSNRKIMSGFDYRKLRGLIKGNAITDLIKLKTHITHVTKPSS